MVLTRGKVNYRNCDNNGYTFIYVYKVVAYLILFDLAFGSLQCPPPVIPFNGQVVMKWDGNVAQYKCKPGFVLIGSATAMCRNARWNHSPPLCREGHPATPESPATDATKGLSQYSLLRSLSDLQYQHEYNIPENSQWGTSRLRTNSKRPLFSWDSAEPTSEQPKIFDHPSMPNDEAAIRKRKFQLNKANAASPSSKLRLRASSEKPSNSPLETRESTKQPRRKNKRPKKERNKKTKLVKVNPTIDNALVSGSSFNMKYENDSDVFGGNGANERFNFTKTLPVNSVGTNDLKKNGVFVETVPPAVAHRENGWVFKEMHKNVLVKETPTNEHSRPKIVAKHGSNTLEIARETTLAGQGVPSSKLVKSNTNSTHLHIVNLSSDSSQAETKKTYYLPLNYSEISLDQLDMSCMTNTSNGTEFLPAPEIQNGSIEMYRRRHNADEPFNSYLEVFYACQDDFYFEDSLAHSLYCFQERWIGELPHCALRNSKINNTADLGINDDDPEIGNQLSCQLNKGGCEHICEENLGGIACSCHRGHYLKDDGKSCEDINECEVNNGSCQYKCWNIPGTYVCFCPDGYGLGSNRKSCLDKNECLLNNGHGPCQDVCVNIEGSYQCTCSIQGTTLSTDNHTCEDIDECAKDNFGCSHFCLNTIGSAFCSCNDGYMLGDDWKTCEDIDECQFPELAQNCKGDCINTIGSYKCGREVVSTVTDHVSNTEIEKPPEIEKKFETICESGYVKDDNQKCIDINECSLNNFGCSHICINTPGSASCSCTGGYNLLEDWKTCEDINECDNGELACSHDCVNINGSAHCTCPQGYTLLQDGKTCEDINECSDSNGGCNQICVNTQGRYHCACETTYELADNGQSCKVAFCEAPKSPTEVEIICSTNPKQQRFYTLGTSCKVQCPQNMSLNGVGLIRCLENGKWDTENYNCSVPQLCPTLKKPSNGNIKPASCFSHSKEEGEYCYYSCNEGYTLSGNSLRTCSRDRHWHPQELPECVRDISVEMPVIYCPPPTIVDLPYNQKKAFVRVPRPKSSVDERYIRVFPTWIKNCTAEFPPGTIVVTFQAVHPISNRNASCATRVIVQDRQPPMTFNCPQPITDVAIGTYKQTQNVFWEEPIFKDNVAITNIWKSKEPGSALPPGIHHIKYIARDAAGNTGHCGFTIRVSKRINREQVSHGLENRIAQPLLLPFWHKHGCKEMNKLQQKLLAVLHVRMPSLPPIANLHVRSSPSTKRRYELTVNSNNKNDIAVDNESIIRIAKLKDISRNHFIRKSEN